MSTILSKQYYNEVIFCCSCDSFLGHLNQKGADLHQENQQLETITNILQFRQLLRKAYFYLEAKVLPIYNLI